MMNRPFSLHRLTVAAMLLALALLLPFLTAQIPEIGHMLCPMHLPILLCGYGLGPGFGLVIGAIAPLIRSLWFGMPPLYPTAVAMCFELAAYGFFAGLLHRRLPQTKLMLYVSLIGTMLFGRILWGAVMVILCHLSSTAFGWSAFVSNAFLTALPGILLQIVLIPPLVSAVSRVF
ncbi:MAG: ECF transporter S component [Ruminococcaceae bacterium]|nr:ECF transporter S component [Oscillospiraceae bacterium]